MHNGQQKGRLVFFWLGEKIEHWPPRGTDCPDMYIHTREGDWTGWEREGEGEGEYLHTGEGTTVYGVWATGAGGL